MKLDKMNLPEELAQNLKNVERRWLKVQSTTVIFLSLTMFFLSLTVMYVSDRLWDTAPGFRLVLLLLTIVSFVTAVVAWVKRKVNYTRSPYRIIRMVQGHFRSLGDSLEGAVELSDETATAPNISPELCDAAIKQVAGKTEKLNFSESVKTSKCRRYLKYFVLLTVIIVTFFIIEPRAVINSLSRWINPFSSTARYTFVDFETLDNELIVLHGEPFTLQVKVKEDSRIKPDEISWRFSGLSDKSTAVTEGSANLRLPGQTAVTELIISAYDCERTVKIIPVHRPAVEQLTANIKMPAYLKQDNFSFELQGNSLEVIKGSSYSIKGKISNPLKSVKIYSGLKDTFEDILKLSSVDKVIDSEKLLAELISKVPGGLREIELGKDTFSSKLLDPADNSNLLITWKDTHGFDQKKPLELSVSVIEDEPPVIDFENTGRSMALLESENVIFPVKAGDNFGVKYVKVKYEVQGTGNVNFSRSYTVDVAQGSHNSKQLSDEFIFSPNQMKIPAGSKVKITALTNDYLPGRTDITSPEYTVYILSKEEHAKLIQERFEAVMAKIEGVAMQEDENMQKNILTTEMSPEDLNSEKGTEAINEALEGEKANAEQLKDLANEGRELIGEALKNSEFSEEELKEWTEMMEKMEELSEEAMEEVKKELAKAGQQQSPSESALRLEGLKSAIKKQEEILRQMRQLSKELDENMKKASLKNFAARLRNLSKQEKEGAGMLQQLFVKSVGLSFEELPQELKKLNDKILRHQKSINANIKAIRLEIESFYARTKIDKYKEVTDDMDKKKVDEELKKLAGLIETNKTMSAIKPCGEWAKQFDEWANILDPQPDPDEDDGEKPENPPDPKEQDMKFLMALIRVIEQEQNLYEETVFIDKERNRKKQEIAGIQDDKEKTAAEKDLQQTTEKSTSELAERQKKNLDELKELTVQVGDPRVKELMEGAENAMDEAKRGLDKGETGKNTTASESAAVELLISIFSGGGKPNSSAMAAMMAMMGQSMGMGQGMGNSPGGNPGGGEVGATTDVTGTNTTNSPDKRDSKKYNIAMEEIPVEFREALESYYKEVEEVIE